MDLWRKVVIFFLFCLTPHLYAGQNSPYDQPKFNFYVQADDISFWGDTQDNINSKINLKDGVNLARARFSVNGKSQYWRYILTFDAAEKLLRENSLRYEGYKHVLITIGQYKPSYSFLFLTTHREVTFLEEALPVNAFTLGYRIGMQVQLFYDPVTFTMGSFGPDTADTLLGNHLKGHTPLAANFRVTYAPIHTDTKVLHLGMGTVYQDTDSLGRFRFASIPEIQICHNQFLVDTGFIPMCKNYLGQELEAVLLLGSFCAQSEHYLVKVDRQSQDLYFRGYFFMASYFLTGERYLYDFKNGTMQKTTPILHDYGAWQLAFRYSCLNLNDAMVLGGSQKDLSIGLNWFPEKKLKLMINYIMVETNPSDNGLNRHVNILGLRCQLSV